MPEYPNRRVRRFWQHELSTSPVKDVDHDAISVYIIGFQEIVELNSASMLQADEQNLRRWEQTIKVSYRGERTLPAHDNKGTYIQAA